MRDQVTQRLRDPIAWADASQLAKTVGAAVLAWVVAVDLLHLSQAFMAPWAALLTVHATVFGTLRRGAQQAGASVLGVLIAFGASSLFGGGALALGAAVLAAVLAGSVPGLRAPITTATTAAVVLTAGYIGKGGMLTARLEDTAIGIAVGLLVNLLVWPPLRDRAAARHIDLIDDRLGDLLCRMAADLADGAGRERADDWIAHADRLDDDVDRAWRVLEEARESGRLNPRPSAAPRMRAAEEMTQIVNRLAQAVAETRSMARTMRVGLAEWDPGFRDSWQTLLERAGSAVGAADADRIRAVRADLTEFSSGLGGDHLPSAPWPMFGALLVNLRNVLDALDAVAEAQPVRVPAPAMSA
jgi:uncharacterized membrane protein YgaE (UPF0421/DUF939 family)